jgi:hypothetical protein
MTVMHAPPEPELDEDALYDLADAETEAAKKSPALNAPYVPRVASVGAGAGTATATATATAAIAPGRAIPTIGYQRGPTQREKDRFSNKTLIDMKRDCYVPVALIIFGFALYVGYYAVRYELGGAGVAAVTFGISLLTLFKVALLFGFALYTAGPLGVSYGGPLTALLKLGAISVFCDGVTMLVDAGVAKLTGTSAFSGGGIGYSMISFPIALGVYWVLLIYLFSMDSGDSWLVVLLLNIFDYIIRLVLIMLLLKLLFSIGGAATSAIPVPTFGGAPATADPMVEHMNELKERNLLVEARKYIADGHQAVLSKSVEDWYAAGCKNVWFEVSRDINGHATPETVLVELPKDKTKRAKCYQILRDYYDGAGISHSPSELKDRGDSYMTVGIR